MRQSMMASAVVVFVAVLTVLLVITELTVATASLGGSRMNGFYKGISPMSYYSFDDNARFDSSTVDRTGRGFPATLNGIASSAIQLANTGAAAVEDRAISIQNSAGSVRVPFGSAVLSGSSSGASWSVSLFIKPASLPGSSLTEVVVLQTTGSGCGSGWTLFYRGDGSIGVRLASNLVSGTSSGAVVANRWNLIRIGVTNISPVASTLVISAETAVSTFVFVTRSNWLISSSSCTLDVVNSAVAMGVDEMAILDRDFTVDEYDTLQYLGSRGACRMNPCFAGVTCTPTDSTTFTCGSCPPGYFGDGIYCDSTAPQKAAVACYPEGDNTTDPNYCSSSCTTRTKCFACSMFYTGRRMISARTACRQAEISGSVQIVVSRGVQYPWFSISPTKSITPSNSPTTSPTPSMTPTRTFNMLNYGMTSSGPGTSCADIRNNNPSAADGVYYIMPTGYSGSPLKVWCDMTTDGGAWMMIARLHNGALRVMASYYASGNGTSEVDQNYVLPCSLFGDHTVARVVMNQYEDYYRPASGQTLCSMLQSNVKHQWWNPSTGTWVTPTYHGSGLGGSGSGYPTDGRTYLSFWGSDNTGVGGGCCETISWGVPFELYVRIPAASTIGSTSTSPGQSCEHILTSGASMGDGLYWVDPNLGSASDSFQLRCDMRNHGGGWTRIASLTGSTTVYATSYANGMGTPNTGDWTLQCSRLTGMQLSSTVMRVEMGLVRDFFKPNSGETLCSMLQSYTKHQWHHVVNQQWVTPSYYSNHLGGCATNWPSSIDGRSYISFWGGLSTSWPMGCCFPGSNYYESAVPGGAWNQPFSLWVKDFQYTSVSNINQPFGRIGTRSNPGRTCRDILRRGGSVGSGTYYISPASATSKMRRPIPVYCEMSFSGGGWTLVSQDLGYTLWSPYTTHGEIWSMGADTLRGPPAVTGQTGQNSIYTVPLNRAIYQLSMREVYTGKLNSVNISDVNAASAIQFTLPAAQVFPPNSKTSATNVNSNTWCSSWWYSDSATTTRAELWVHEGSSCGTYILSNGFAPRRLYKAGPQISWNGDADTGTDTNNNFGFWYMREA